MTMQLLQVPVRIYALAFANLLFVIAKHARVIVNLALTFDIYALRVVKLVLVVVNLAFVIVKYAKAVVTSTKERVVRNE